MADQPATTKADPPTRVRRVSDAATLKALSDPLRLAILRLLTREVDRRPDGVTVKEMAAELNEPPTKLYRHIRLLEERTLIQVAQTRLVAGIVEHRYRTGQLSLRLDPELLGDGDGPPEFTAAMAAGFDNFRDEYLAATTRQTRLAGDDRPEPTPILVGVDGVVSADRAVELRGRLTGLIDEFFTTEDDDGVPVSLMIAFYTTPP